MLEIKGFFGEYRFLSNFTKAWVKFEGDLYSTTEHAYQAAKTHDMEQRRLIRCAVTPQAAKKLGSEVQLRGDWEEVKDSVMYDLLIQKFSQEPHMSALLQTGDAYLEETNTWNDCYWGVCKGVGQNKLGKMLMKIREDLNSIV